jgi:hypothetical protein
MSKHSEKSAKTAAFSDMSADETVNKEVLANVAATSETANVIAEEETAKTEKPIPAWRNLFILQAIKLLVNGVTSIGIDVVLSSMVAAGYVFTPKGENDKAPKGKGFKVCNTETQAGAIYKFCISELRTKSTVTSNGLNLYYSNGNVFLSQQLPADSVNAWKEALKLKISASGK